ncbi:hypothetical protein CY34DRAFT_804679 [Suillus luteus UH-Slu-Lm8-n1]|uniref:Uncharacterized protein n=1 Tax=Suillus luteus UH-Slu-Lm8-n1 TaxID=930992 RepID=A0A0D0AXZ1_9AGAM|nr:hypothetical protein CY34DRAFT_804679 [Suillus luteus UH-Slu-Lm8-n1]
MIIGSSSREQASSNRAMSVIGPSSTKRATYLTTQCECWKFDKRISNVLAHPNRKLPRCRR